MKNANALQEWRRFTEREFERRYAAKLNAQIEELLKWADAEDLSLDEITRDHLVRYLDERAMRDVITTRALKRFFRERKDRFLTDRNPAETLKVPPRSDLAGPRTTEQQIGEYLAKCRLACEVQTPQKVTAMLARLRAWAIAETIYACGATSEQLAGVQPDGHDGRSYAICIEERWVPITRQASWAINLWSLASLEFTRQRPSYIFHSSRSPQKKMFGSSINLDLVNIGRLIGIEMSPQAIRFAFLQHMMARGFPPEMLAQMSGYKGTSRLFEHAAG